MNKSKLIYGLIFTLLLTPIHSAFSDNGHDEFQVNTYEPGDQFEPVVASDADGNFVVVFSDNTQGRNGSGEVYGQMYNMDGTANGAEFRVNTNMVGNQGDASVAMADNGVFVVAWASENQSQTDVEIYGQMYEADGDKRGEEFQVNTITTGLQWTPSVAMDNNENFVVAWSNNAGDATGLGIRGQRFASNGTAQGSEFQIGLPMGTDMSVPGHPSIEMDRNGNFTVVWDDSHWTGNSWYWGVYGQRYNANGTTRGSVFQVNTSYTDTFQSEPSVSVNDSGKFVVVWHDQGDPAFGAPRTPGVRGQRYNANGTKQGNEFEVSSIGNNVQPRQQAAIDNDGNFTVVWLDLSGGTRGLHGGRAEVFGQRFTSNGNPNGNKFQVNTYTDNDQEFPALAMLPDGNEIVAWHSDSDQDDERYELGVYAKIYPAPLRWGPVLGVQSNKVGLVRYTGDGENNIANIQILTPNGTVIDTTDDFQFSSQVQSGSQKLLTFIPADACRVGAEEKATQLPLKLRFTYNDGGVSPTIESDNPYGYSCTKIKKNLDLKTIRVVQPKNMLKRHFLVP